MIDHELESFYVAMSKNNISKSLPTEKKLLSVFFVIMHELNKCIISAISHISVKLLEYVMFRTKRDRRIHPDFFHCYSLDQVLECLKKNLLPLLRSRLLIYYFCALRKIPHSNSCANIQEH